MGSIVRRKKRPLRVFLCHSKSDKAAVRQLYQQLLAEDSIEPWLDEENLLPGQDWVIEIRRAVRSADVVVVCLSSNSINQAGFVQEEIRYALDVADELPMGTIYIIPTRLEECIVPDRLRRWQWVDLFQQHGFARLMNSLRARAHSIGVAPTSGVDRPAHHREHRPRLTITSEVATVGGFILALLAFLGYSTYGTLWNSDKQGVGVRDAATTNASKPPIATSTADSSLAEASTSAITPMTTGIPTVTTQPTPLFTSIPSPPIIGTPPSDPIISENDIGNANPEMVPNSQTLRGGDFEYHYSLGLSNFATGSYGGARPARGRYLIVLISVRNVGANPQQIPDGFFVVKHGQDRVSDFNRAASIDYTNRFGGTGPGGVGDYDANTLVQPGQPFGSMALLFDVAGDATDFVLFSRDNISQGFRVR